MTTRADWEGGVGATWAAEWRRTDRSFAALQPHLTEAALAALAASAVPPRILDVGCGAGATTLALARARPDARLLGLDVAPDLIDVARGRSAEAPGARFAVGDASDYDVGEGAFDLIISRHGVMFFADPVAAFARLRRAATDGAALVFTCFRARSENGWAEALADIAGDAASAAPMVPGPFAFADPAPVRAALERAGWADVAFAAVDYPYVAGAGSDPVADAVDFFTRIGPAARALREADGDRRARLIERLAALCAAHCVEGKVHFPAAAWLVTGRKREAPSLG